MKVFITGKIPSIASEFLLEKGYKIKVYKKNFPISQQELIHEVKDADAVISLLTDKFDKKIISQMERCRIIANYAVGFNNIDVNLAKEKGIVVTNTPDVLTEATAEIAISLALCCARRIVEGDKFVRAGKFKGWKPDLLLGTELKNKTFGIIGAGRIGTAASIRAKAFEMKIIYFSRTRNAKLEKLTGAKKVTLNNLLKISDFISIHVPLTKDTFHLIDKKRLSLLKKSAILINTSRGEIIDEKELIKMLKNRRIFSAGFDVYENEPVINPDLLKLDNIVLLPHIGSATIETRNNMAMLAARNVDAVLKEKKALTPVY